MTPVETEILTRAAEAGYFREAIVEQMYRGGTMSEAVAPGASALLGRRVWAAEILRSGTQSDLYDALWADYDRR